MEYYCIVRAPFFHEGGGKRVWLHRYNVSVRRGWGCPWVMSVGLMLPLGDECRADVACAHVWAGVALCGIQARFLAGVAWCWIRSWLVVESRDPGVTVVSPGVAVVLQSCAADVLGWEGGAVPLVESVPRGCVCCLG